MRLRTLERITRSIMRADGAKLKRKLIRCINSATSGKHKLLSDMRKTSVAKLTREE